MWHTCEEALSANVDWKIALKSYCKMIAAKYRGQQLEVNHWYQTCLVQFPIYEEYWSKQKDVTQRTPLLQEYTFHVPYRLGTGRTVYLRGKFDAVDLIKGDDSGIYLQENKTKGDVDLIKIKRQLTFDIQTMMYLVALKHLGQQREIIVPYPGYNLKGVRYNVIRRPFSGGRGSIRKHKAKTTKKAHTPEESDESYYGRLRDIIREDVFNTRGQAKADNDWFARWKIQVTPEDIEKFKGQFLDPILENLCNDYSWWKVANNDGINVFDHEARRLHSVFKQGRFDNHYRLPFGVYNVIAEGGHTEYDEMLATGNTVGLVRGTTLFEELQ